MSVALCFQGGRIATLSEPLAAVESDFSINPDSLDGYDTIITDSPSALIVKYNLTTTANVVLRLRGNVWKERRQYNSHTGFLSDRFVLRWVDGLLAPDSRLDRCWQSRVGKTPSTVIDLPIKPQQWPTVKHTSQSLRAVTLTNADYEAKIRPLIDWIPTVDRVLADTGGRWLIGGDGEYSADIKAAADGCANVEYGGFIDAKTSLKTANLLLHPSWFDIRAPNAIIEGMASNLPVVTTDFAPFRETPAVQATQSTLSETLRRFTDPTERSIHGLQQRKYLHERHNPEKIGTQMQAFINNL